LFALTNKGETGANLRRYNTGGAVLLMNFAKDFLKEDFNVARKESHSANAGGRGTESVNACVNVCAGKRRQDICERR
jgi:hypothetical protein